MEPVPGCWQEVGWPVLHTWGAWHSISPALHSQGQPGAGLSVPNSLISDAELPFLRKHLGGCVFISSI